MSRQNPILNGLYHTEKKKKSLERLVEKQDGTIGLACDRTDAIRVDIGFPLAEEQKTVHILPVRKRPVAAGQGAGATIISLPSQSE